MKTLSLLVSLEGIKLSPDDKDKAPREVMVDTLIQVILNACSQKQGMREDERRKFYKIQDAFDAVIKDKKDEIEMDDDWFGFIKQSFRDIKCMPNKLLQRVEELVMAVKDR